MSHQSHGCIACAEVTLHVSHITYLELLPVEGVTFPIPVVLQHTNITDVQCGQLYTQGPDNDRGCCALG